MSSSYLNEIETLRAIIAESPTPIGLYLGREMRIVVANKAILQAWGKNESVIGKTFHDAIPELNSQPFDKLLDDVYTTGIPYHANEDQVDLVVDGLLQTFYFNFTYKPLKDKDGRVWGVINTATNVTYEVVARRKLQEAEEQLRMAVESAEMGTWSINAQSRRFFHSARTKELFGFAPDEDITYEKAFSRIDPEYRNQVIETINTAMQKGGNYDLEFLITYPDTNKQHWLRSTGKLYYDTYGKPSNFSGILMDITDRKQEEIRKNDFIAMVSHELKTPLTSIKSYIQIALIKATKTGDDFLASALAKADRQIVKMTNMIRGFLDLSKLESGKITLTPERFDINDLIAEVVNDAKFLAQSHFFEVDNCGDAIVYADRNKISQVLDNFLSNAVKYSPKETTIEVKCGIEDKHIQVAVADKGIGVKLKDQAKLFDRFYRVDNDIMNTVSGFGIGLYLAGEIIRLHNGKIWVESNEYEGSVFYFSLPLA